MFQFKNTYNSLFTDLNKTKLFDLSKKLFLLLVLIIPLNIGKHFLIKDAYVWGVLTDYLIPTVYIQDIIAFLILLLWILSGGVKKFINKGLLEKREIQFSILFILSILFSVLSSSRFIPSFYFWLRLLMYFILFLYVYLEIPSDVFFFKIINTLAVSVLLVSLLGITQFFNKGSVFNNYLYFGEQPYSASTYGISKEAVFGKNVVPSYGLFRHPNTFGGFLSVSLLLLFVFIKKSNLYLVSFIAGITCLIFTFSYSSWLVLIFGILIHIFLTLPSRELNAINIRRKKIKVLVLGILFSISMLFIPLFPNISKSLNPSLYRRSNLLMASYKVFRNYPLFGVGLNNLTIFIDNYIIESRDIRFTQPVHNVFALIAAETGIFSFILFILFLYYVSKKLVNVSYFYVFLITFIQIIMLSSLDHYFLTMHQTLLMFWILLGLFIQ